MTAHKQTLMHLQLLYLHSNACHEGAGNSTAVRFGAPPHTQPPPHTPLTHTQNNHTHTHTHKQTNKQTSKQTNTHTHTHTHTRGAPNLATDEFCETAYTLSHEPKVAERTDTRAAQAGRRIVRLTDSLTY